MLIPFSDLPATSRIWIFAAGDPLDGAACEALLQEVDAYLGQWKAHGLPLTCARDWRENRFLAIGVDQSAAHASGCSIDGLFRVLQRLEASLGTSLVGGGRVFYRDAGGRIMCASRAEFAERLAAGRVGESTPVFDTSLADLAGYRERFEVPAGQSWATA